MTRTIRPRTRSAGKTTPQSAAIYARISDDKLGEGLGVDRQERLCRELAQRLGWEVTETYTDNSISASSASALADLVPDATDVQVRQLVVGVRRTART